MAALSRAALRNTNNAESGSAVAARNELYQDAKRVVHFTTDGFRKRNALHAESLAQLGARQSHFTMSSSDRLVAGSVGAWETRRPPAAGFPLSPSIPRLSASTPPIDESASRGHRTAEVASQNPTAVLPPTHVRRVKSATGSSRRPLPARRRPRKHTTPALPERHRRTGASMQRHEEPTQVTSAASRTSRASTSTLDRARAPPVLSSRVASGSRGRLLSGRSTFSQRSRGHKTLPRGDSTQHLMHQSRSVTSPVSHWLWPADVRSSTLLRAQTADGYRKGPSGRSSGVDWFVAGPAPPSLSEGGALRSADLEVARRVRARARSAAQARQAQREAQLQEQRAGGQARHTPARSVAFAADIVAGDIAAGGPQSVAQGSSDKAWRNVAQYEQLQVDTSAEWSQPPSAFSSRARPGSAPHGKMSGDSKRSSTSPWQSRTPKRGRGVALNKTPRRVSSASFLSSAEPRPHSSGRSSTRTSLHALSEYCPAGSQSDGNCSSTSPWPGTSEVGRTPSAHQVQAALAWGKEALPASNGSTSDESSVHSEGSSGQDRSKRLALRMKELTANLSQSSSDDGAAGPRHPGVQHGANRANAKRTRHSSQRHPPRGGEGEHSHRRSRHRHRHTPKPRAKTSTPGTGPQLRKRRRARRRRDRQMKMVSVSKARPTTLEPMGQPSGLDDHALNAVEQEADTGTGWSSAWRKQQQRATAVLALLSRPSKEALLLDLSVLLAERERRWRRGLALAATGSIPEGDEDGILLARRRASNGAGRGRHDVTAARLLDEAGIVMPDKFAGDESGSYLGPCAPGCLSARARIRDYDEEARRNQDSEQAGGEDAAQKQTKMRIAQTVMQAAHDARDNAEAGKALAAALAVRTSQLSTASQDVVSDSSGFQGSSFLYSKTGAGAGLLEWHQGKTVARAVGFMAVPLIGGPFDTEQDEALASALAVAARRGDGPTRWLREAMEEEARARSDQARTVVDRRQAALEAARQAALEELEEREQRRAQAEHERSQQQRRDAQRMEALAAARRAEFSGELLAKRRAEAAARRQAQEEARQRREARRAAREKARERAEREAMLEEEWAQQRGQWWGNSDEQSNSDWRTVRVFISSTFRDMHGERDAITRHVFPALNQRARSRRVRAVPVDLRWGLTSQDTSDAGLGALEHCLLEVEVARPFTVVLSGERYGWIPPRYDMCTARVRAIPLTCMWFATHAQLPCNRSGGIRLDQTRTRWAQYHRHGDSPCVLAHTLSPDPRLSVPA